MKRVFTLVMLLVLISLVSAVALAIPAEPHQFYGTVVVGNVDAQVGSIISTTIGGVSAGSITVSTAGQYGGASTFSPKLTVTCPPDNADIDCAGVNLIEFSISGSGCSSVGTLSLTFRAGNIDELRLEFPGTCVSVAGGGAGVEGGGGGGGGAAAVAAEEIKVTEAGIIDAIKKSLPADWVNIEAYQIGTSYSETVELTTALIDETLKLATDTRAITKLQLIKAALQENQVEKIPVVVSLIKYKVLNLDKGIFVYRTKFTVTITAVKNMKNVEIVEVIPKSVAVKASDIVFLQTPKEILEEDPIALWVLDYIPKGETREIEYVVNGLYSRIFQKTIVVGVEAPPEEKPPEVVPPPEEKPPEVVPPVKPVPWVGIIIIAAIVVLGLIVYWRASKKK